MIPAPAQRAEHVDRSRAERGGMQQRQLEIGLVFLACISAHLHAALRQRCQRGWIERVHIADHQIGQALGIA